MLQRVPAHLFDNVLPDAAEYLAAEYLAAEYLAAEYLAAEHELSAAYRALTRLARLWPFPQSGQKRYTGSSH